MRAALEVVALRNAAPKLTPAHMAKIELALIEGDNAETLQEFETANRAFHQALVAPCAMPRLLASLDGLQLANSRLVFAMARNAGWRPRSNQDHRLILQALRTRNLDQACSLLDASHPNHRAPDCARQVIVAESTTRRPPAGWQPQWRRSATNGVQSGTGSIVAMNSTVAYHKFPLREPGQSAVRKGQKVSVQERVDPTSTACRGLPENSNRAIVRFGHGSGFLAWICPVTVEIFSAEIASVRR